MQKITAAVLTVGVLTVGIIGAGAAQAAPFTLASDVEFSGAGVTGTVSGISGAEFASLDLAVDTVCGFDTAGVGCDLAGGGLDFAVFRVAVTESDGGGLGIDELRVSNLFATVEGAGHFAGAGAVPGVTKETGSTTLFSWADLNDLNSPSAILFVAHNAGELPTLNGINLNPDPTSGAVGGIDNVSGQLVPVVPEPASVVLVGLGIVALAVAGRRRQL